MQQQTHAQKRPRPAGRKGLRPLSSASAGFLTTLGGLFFFLPSKPCCPCQEAYFTRDLSSAEQPSFVRASGAHLGWDSMRSRKAGVRTGLSWSRQGCEGAGTAEASGCQGHQCKLGIGKGPRSLASLVTGWPIILPALGEATI